MPYAAGAAAVFVVEWAFARRLAANPWADLAFQLILAYLVFLGVISLFKSSRIAAIDIATEASALARRMLPTPK